jgi:molecular chaperone GrpE
MDNTKDEISEKAFEPIDSIMQLEADLAAAKVEIAEWRDSFMRKAAELENYRKRMDKEKQELRILSQSTILRDILPIVDGLDRAMKYFGDEEKDTGLAKQYRQGVELLCRQVLDTLALAGVKPIETEGKPFDPYLHEALSREETSEFDEGIVVSEFRRGYMFRDSLLRPSQVIVAVQPKEPRYPHNSPDDQFFESTDYKEGLEDFYFIFLASIINVSLKGITKTKELTN